MKEGRASCLIVGLLTVVCHCMYVGLLFPETVTRNHAITPPGDILTAIIFIKFHTGTHSGKNIFFTFTHRDLMFIFF